MKQGRLAGISPLLGLTFAAALLGSLAVSLAYGSYILLFYQPQIGTDSGLSFLLGLSAIMSPITFLLALPSLLLILLPLRWSWRQRLRQRPLMAVMTCGTIGLLLGCILSLLLRQASFDPPVPLGMAFGAIIGAIWAWMVQRLPMFGDQDAGTPSE